MVLQPMASYIRASYMLIAARTSRARHCSTQHLMIIYHIIDLRIHFEKCILAPSIIRKHFNYILQQQYFQPKLNGKINSWRSNDNDN